MVAWPNATRYCPPGKKESSQMTPVGINETGTIVKLKILVQLMIKCRKRKQWVKNCKISIGILKRSNSNNVIFFRVTCKA